MTVTPGNGQFEITENKTVVASGRISIRSNDNADDHNDDDGNVSTRIPEHFALNSDDIYKELRLRGYDYGPAFRGILSANMTGKFLLLYWPDISAIFIHI